MSTISSPQAFSISLEDDPLPSDVSVVRQALQVYNLLYAPADNYRPLHIFLRTPNRTILGGLLGATYWGWLHVNILWIDESLRHQGYGKQFLHLAEQEAIRRGCHAAYLDTMSFQALAFYEGAGYSVYGVLKDFPLGHSRIYLQKSLRETDVPLPSKS